MPRFWVTWRTHGELHDRCSSKTALKSSKSFSSVTDRFLSEMGPVASGHVPKDGDMKYENLVRGLKHVQIKVSVLRYYCTASSIMCSSTAVRSGPQSRSRRAPNLWKH